MAKILLVYGVLFSLIVSPISGFAQAVEVTDETAVDGTRKESAPQVGEGAARKYFRNRTDKTNRTTTVRTPANSGERYLALHLGTFISEDIYKWGNGRKDQPGQLNGGVTYKLGEWTNSMDYVFKADITSYGLDEGQAVKLSLVPAITFPDVNSAFPLYFGAGAGLGIFIKQISEESSLSFDYTVFAGARFFEVFEGVGFLFEVGLKNHILLLSDGQFNGVYIAGGALFQF